MKQHRASRIGEGAVLSIAATIVAALFFAWWALTVLWYGNAKDLEKFGGPFEGISALFAGLGCAGVAISLWYQTKQIQAQQAEVEETTKTLHEQVEALNAQARAVNAQVEALTRPYMTARVYLQHDTARILIIENIGRTQARQLHMRLSRPFMIHWEGVDRAINMQEIQAFSSTISTYPPGMKLEYYLLRGKELRSPTRNISLLPTVFEIEMSYEGADGAAYCETTVINLMDHQSTIEDTDMIRRELDEIATHVEAMANTQKDIAKALARRS